MFLILVDDLLDIIVPVAQQHANNEIVWRFIKREKNSFDLEKSLITIEEWTVDNGLKLDLLKFHVLNIQPRLTQST